MAQALAGEQVLQAWREYAHARIVPDFDWADRPQAAAPDLASVAFGRLASSRLPGGRLGVSMERSSGALRDTGRSSGAFAPMRLSETTPGALQQDVVSPGVMAQTRLGQVEVGAVFAYQRFASWDMGAFGARQAAGPGLVDPLGGRPEAAFGQGVRLGLSGDLGERLGYAFSYRSRIDMDAFNSFRGVYAEPGRFDIPAEVGTRLSWKLGTTTAVALGVDQIQYSGVKPFLSPSLPNRFLALLGDATSPSFRWRDLNVYSAEWRWLPTAQDSFTLRYSTSQQPVPTAPALRRALDEGASPHQYGIGYLRRLADGFHLGFNASYAPTAAFLGLVDPFQRPYRDSRQIEAELLFSAQF
ncbi:MAG: hypothetical protein KF823_15510 [Xanthomonadales bacterium]|nr:hypothetical protein [Xanthomonadales bacterium]